MSPRAAPQPKGGVFFLSGEETFLKERRTREILESHLEDGTRDFNLDVLDGARLDRPAFASVLETPPMMAKWRVVLVRSAEAFASKPKLAKILLGCARNPPPGLAVVAQATIPPRSKAKFYREIRKAARAEDFSRIENYELPSWLTAHARDAMSIELELGAARALTAALGRDLGRLIQEVGKLSQMVGEGSAVDVRAVKRGGFSIPRQDLWGWSDLVAERKTAEAIRGLRILLEQGESAVRLVINLAPQLLRVGAAAEGGTAALKAALPSRMSFLSKKLMRQSRAWRPDEICSAIRGLERLDLLLKSSAMDDGGLFEEWILSTSRSIGRDARGAVS